MLPVEYTPIRIPHGYGIAPVFSWDFNTATLAAIGLQTIYLVTHLVATHIRAKSAYELAKDAHEKIALINAAIALVREQYVHNDDLRAMEARLMAHIDKVGDRLDNALDRRLPK